VPFPAKVVMMPVAAVTFRILSFAVSLRYMSPFAATTMPAGEWSRADVAGPPSPLDPEGPLPATVVMIPVAAETFRTWWFPVSAI